VLSVGSLAQSRAARSSQSCSKQANCLLACCTMYCMRQCCAAAHLLQYVGMFALCMWWLFMTLYWFS
jgi:hypothetical protein